MSEADEQAAVVAYCRERHIPIYHIPNEGKRSYQAGRYMKRQGLSAGVPDLCIPVPRGRYHSLYIEMKYGKNKVTDKQLDWINLLRSHGHCAAVCYGADNAISLINKYFAL